MAVKISDVLRKEGHPGYAIDVLALETLVGSLRAQVEELNGRIIDLENTVNAIADPWDYETGLEKTADACRAIATDCVSRLNL